MLLSLFARCFFGQTPWSPLPPLPPTSFGVPAEKEEKKNHISCRGGKPSQGRNQPVALSRSPRPGSKVLAPGLWGALAVVIRNQSKATLVCWTHTASQTGGAKSTTLPRSTGFLNTPRGLFARGNRPLSYLLTHTPSLEPLCTRLTAAWDVTKVQTYTVCTLQ